MTAVHQVARALSRPRFLVVLFVVLFAVMAAQCGGDASTPAPAATTTTTTVLPVATRLCDAASPTQIGQLQSPELEELSGLAASRQHADVLWAHNDSGDTARIFAIDLTGALRATVDVDVAKAIDWEDIAADGTTLYVARHRRQPARPHRDLRLPHHRACAHRDDARMPRRSRCATRTARTTPRR